MIIQSYLTQNDCYKSNKPLLPIGIMVHSTATPGAMAKNFLKSWNVAKPNNKQVCVHAFIDNTGIYQTLPWQIRAWHCGSGSKGSGNNTHIGFEICEPKDLLDGIYFESIWKQSTKLCTDLCKQFNISPDNIICHSEAYKLGIASNHADVMHWFPRHNKTMEDFRNEVKRLIAESKLDNKADLYAIESVNKMIGKGILKGDDKGNLKLHDPITRQDLCVILDRCGILGR